MRWWGTGIAFIGFLLSLGAGIVGSVLGATVAGLASILTLFMFPPASIILFNLFNVLRHVVAGDQRIGYTRV